MIFRLMPLLDGGLITIILILHKFLHLWIFFGTVTFK